MSQVRSGPEPAPATLVGSLAAFALLDVLDLLSRTGRTGELQVVGPGVDRRVWVDRGDVVGASPSGELFELARIEEGWFYFTLDDAVPEGTGRMPLSSVIGDLATQVSEWRSLLTTLPLEATVRMSTSTPADQVQIRADQWQLLSLIGAGRTVHEVVEAATLHPLDTLRTIRELADGLLVSVEPLIEPIGYGEPGRRYAEPASYAEPDVQPAADTTPTAAPDEAAPTPEPARQAELLTLAAEEAPPPIAPIVTAPVGETGSTSAPGRSTTRTERSIMPPPISGDPWSTPTPFSSRRSSGRDGT